MARIDPSIFVGRRVRPTPFGLSGDERDAVCSSGAHSHIVHLCFPTDTRPPQRSCCILYTSNKNISHRSGAIVVRLPSSTSTPFLNVKRNVRPIYLSPRRPFMFIHQTVMAFSPAFVMGRNMGGLMPMTVSYTISIRLYTLTNSYFIETKWSTKPHRFMHEDLVMSGT